MASVTAQARNTRAASGERAFDAAAGWSLTVPDGWAQIPQEPDEEGFSAFVMAPAEWSEDLGFRPNIWVMTGRETDESVASLATQTVAVTLDQASTRVIAHDLWGDQQGRRLVSTYQSETALICVTQWIRLHRGRPFTLVASVDADRYLRVTHLINGVVDSLSFEEA